MKITDHVDKAKIEIAVDLFETSVEELEDILAPTPSIPIPPPIRFR